MTHTACLVCLFSTVSGLRKNALGRGSASSRHITKIQHSKFSLDIYDLPWCQYYQCLQRDRVVISDVNKNDVIQGAGQLGKMTSPWEHPAQNRGLATQFVCFSNTLKFLAFIGKYEEDPKHSLVMMVIKQLVLGRQATHITNSC